MKKVNIVWFRRDLRLHDHAALHAASQQEGLILPLFIFDTTILDQLPRQDARVQFIHQTLSNLNKKIGKHGSGFLIKHGAPKKVWKSIIKEYEVKSVTWARDYEPEALERDKGIVKLLNAHDIFHQSVKDHLIFEPGEVLKDDGEPYTVYTPYKNKWLKAFSKKEYKAFPYVLEDQFYPHNKHFPGLEDLGFEPSPIKVPELQTAHIEDYGKHRDFPAQDKTTHLGPHIRFGTVSVREMVEKAQQNAVYLSELVWREFFVQILYYFPHVVKRAFREKYDWVKWTNNEAHFERWCAGKTGYPMVDAGMRQLNETGYMHNRVRMVTASFLVKHLGINWQWGESYFAEKLLDFDLAANNGNWQWAAGTGCDAAPYFRVFNPELQQKKFDPDGKYVRKYVPEVNDLAYINSQIVAHAPARDKAIERYKKGLAAYENR